MPSGAGPKGKRNRGEVRRTRPPFNQPLAKKVISQDISGSVTDHMSQRMAKRWFRVTKHHMRAVSQLKDRDSYLKHEGAMKCSAISWLSSGCFLGVRITSATGAFEKKSKFDRFIVRGSLALSFGLLGQSSPVTIQDLARWDGSVSYHVKHDFGLLESCQDRSGQRGEGAFMGFLSACPRLWTADFDMKASRICIFLLVQLLHEWSYSCHKTQQAMLRRSGISCHDAKSFPWCLANWQVYALSCW
jgi:hypothetical protein